MRDMQTRYAEKWGETSFSAASRSLLYELKREGPVEELRGTYLAPREESRKHLGPAESVKQEIRLA